MMTGRDDTLCLHDLFEAQVDRAPERPAITFENQTLSYLELDRRANQLAHHLRRLGVAGGDLVAIYFERSINPILSMLACFKAGAGYVPLDPIYPVERIRFILQDATVAAVLTEQALAEQAVAADAHIPSMRAGWRGAVGAHTLNRREHGAASRRALRAAPCAWMTAPSLGQRSRCSLIAWLPSQVSLACSTHGKAA